MLEVVISHLSHAHPGRSDCGRRGDLAHSPADKNNLLPHRSASLLHAAAIHRGPFT